MPKNKEKGNDILVLRHKYPVRIGLLSDLHAGETRAGMGDKFITSEGIIITPNEIQKIINRHWKKVMGVFKKYKINYLFVVGDCFAGQNPAEYGAYRFLTNPDQIRLAKELLLPICKLPSMKKVLIWKGTQYHEVKAGLGEMHKVLVDELRAEGIDAEFMGDHAYVELETEKGKKLRRLFVAHEAPTGLVHPATLMSREIEWALSSEAKGLTLPVDAVIRAHLHHWLHIDQSGIHAVQLPCWLAHVPYKTTIKYFFKLQPDIGGALMLVDDAGRLRIWDFAMRDKEKKKELARLVAGLTRIGKRNQQIMQTGTESGSIESGIVGKQPEET